MCSISVAATVLLIASDLNEETLVCRAEGNPPPHVSWTGPDGEVTKTSTGEARISLGNLGQGKYTCEATNTLGSDQNSYTVTRKDFFWPVAFCCFYLLNYLVLLSFMSVLSFLSPLPLPFPSQGPHSFPHDNFYFVWMFMFWKMTSLFTV